MAVNGIESLDGVISEFNRRVLEFSDRMIQVLKDELNQSVEDVYKDIADDQRRQITRLFNDAVTRFYNDKSEGDYKRAGNVGTKSGGLYEALVLNEGEHGLIQYDDGYRDLIDPIRMTINIPGHRMDDITDQFGLAETIFNQAFFEGYHGGAANIASRKAERWGQHPNPGVPYYRKPGFARDKHGNMKWHKYGTWGSRAKKAKVIPFEDFSGMMKAYDSSLEKRWQPFADKRANEASERASERIQEIWQEVCSR